MVKLKLIKTQHTLVYAMRLFPGEALAEQDHPRLSAQVAPGREETLTLHAITGDKEEIKRKLAASVDAFFEIMGEHLP